MVEIGEEEVVNIDNIADGMSEMRPDKKKEKKSENKQNKETDENKEKPKQKLKKSVVALLIFAIVLVLGVVGYVTVVFGNIPFVVKWRNIWIETAMTTDQHKWLATWFFPDSLIEEVMSGQVDIKDISVTDIYGNQSSDVLGQEHLVEGEKDKFGNKVFANDLEENIVILEIKKSNFVGKLVLVDDPSRVFLGATNYKGSRGEFICDYLEKENAVVGVNASGFIDRGGVSLGGEIAGQCVSKGEYWGRYDSRYTLVGFDKDNRLVVGGIEDWEDYNIRDGFQYKPTLILNGKKVVEDSAGWGLQPRTVVGQCKNGVVLLLVIDGRQVGHSIGATMEDCADILLQYGAVTAGACDGGSSSVIGYDGEVINKPCARDMPTGRYLPNAWLVARKDTKQDKK